MQIQVATYAKVTESKLFRSRSEYCILLFYFNLDSNKTDSKETICVNFMKTISNHKGRRRRKKKNRRSEEKQEEEEGAQSRK